MQKITLNEQRLHDKQATRFFTLLFDLGGGGHLLPTAKEQTSTPSGSAQKPCKQATNPPRYCEYLILIGLVKRPDCIFWGKNGPCNLTSQVPKHQDH